MAAREESTRNETANIKLNRAPFSLRWRDEAHPHDVLIPPWRIYPTQQTAPLRAGGPPTSSALSPPHYSRRSPFISSSDQDFSHHALCRRSLLRPFPNGPPREKCRCPAWSCPLACYHGIFGCPKQSACCLSSEPWNCAWLGAAASWASARLSLADEN